jgi:hypothetical protein
MHVKRNHSFGNTGRHMSGTPFLWYYRLQQQLCCMYKRLLRSLKFEVRITVRLSKVRSKFSLKVHTLSICIVYTLHCPDTACPLFILPSILLAFSMQCIAFRMFPALVSLFVWPLSQPHKARIQHQSVCVRIYQYSSKLNPKTFKPVKLVKRTLLVFPSSSSRDP